MYGFTALEGVAERAWVTGGCDKGGSATLQRGEFVKGWRAGFSHGGVGSFGHFPDAEPKG